MDVGYGKGIVPKEQMRTLPLHPHCRCRYRPYRKKVEKKRIKSDPFRNAMDEFSKKEKARILGSYDKLQKFYDGVHPERIFNER